MGGMGGMDMEALMKQVCNALSSFHKPLDLLLNFQL